MESGDFFGSEISTIAEENNEISIVFEEDKKETLLAEKIKVTKGEIIDSAFMSKKALCDFFEKQIKTTPKDVLFSLHLKATMMKISDPKMFGHCVRAYYKEALEKHSDVLEQLGIDPNNGIGDVYEKISELPEKQAQEIKKDLDACLENGPDLAMVNSDKGITNLHVPSDVIVDASMPAMIRNSGQMWNKEGKSQDTKAVIPDSSYAGIYQATIDFCKENDIHY